MELKTVVARLNKHAGTYLAESWDNVGLLVEPSPPHVVEKMLLTNDLTLEVMTEALEKKVSMILSYHPPIFVPMKRLTQAQWKERIIIKCIENKVAVYSPHTCYDAVEGGVNDWLLQPFEGVASPLSEVSTQMYPTSGGHRVEVTVPTESVATLIKDVESMKNGVTFIHKSEFTDNKGLPRQLWILNCTDKKLPEITAAFAKFEEVYPTMQVCRLNKPPMLNHGMGRVCKLKNKTTLKDVIEKVKVHLKMSQIRLALALDQTTDQAVKTVAVCAGSGSSVLKGTKADVYITGEMSHHEVLEATQRGISVILCEHSNTERGFLSHLKEVFGPLFDEKVEILISEKDRDPLAIY